jgi:16S rRNA G527 N7-methylase RsmG
MYGHPFFGYRRKFFTEEETKELEKQYRAKRIEWIENYKESLEAELKAVNERLEEIKKEQE